MKLRTFFCGFLFIFLFSCSSSSPDSIKEQEKASYEQAKNALLEKEQNNPVMFLSVIGGFKKNLIGQTVITGKISSSATVARYKDIDVKLDFYSETKTLLESDTETVYLEIKPGQTQSFKTKYFAPKGTDSVALVVRGAKIVNPVTE